MKTQQTFLNPRVIKQELFYLLTKFGHNKGKDKGMYQLPKRFITRLLNETYLSFLQPPLFSKLYC